MAFTPRSVESGLALGSVHPEDLPGLAIEALIAGYDGHSTRRLAGLMKPSGWETDPLLPGFVLETGMQPVTKKHASLYFAAELASEVLASRKDPLKRLSTFAGLCVDADYLEDLMPLYRLDDEVYLGGSIYGRTLDQVRFDARDELIRLVRKQNTQAPSALSEPL